MVLKTVTWKNCFELSLLSYFDVYKENRTVEELILSILLDSSLLERYKNDFLFQLNIASVWQIDASEYRNVYIEEVINDNVHSGVYLYRLRWNDIELIAIRGSEEADDLEHKTGWQDWRDNFEMYLPGPTAQQLKIVQYMNTLECDKQRILCGHSKGGNLSIFALLTASQCVFDAIAHVYAFNAPGITDSVVEDYKMRLNSEAFLDKITLLENEHDCISSFFHHVKEPHIIASRIGANTIKQMYENHQLHAMKFEEDTFALCDRKSAIPRLVHHFVNDFFVKQSPERLRRMVYVVDEYFDSGLSKSEMYRVLLYQISKYTRLFDELAYEDIGNITFQHLLEQRRSKVMLKKIKEMRPITALNEIDMRKIGDAIIENYEATIQSKRKALRKIVKENNVKIMDTIKQLQDRK